MTALLPVGEGARYETRRRKEPPVVGTVDNAGNGKVCPAIRYLEEVLQTAGLIDVRS